MRIGLSCGWLENYWGDWFTAKQYGGSEHIAIELAAELAAQGHEVTVRFPYEHGEMVARGVRWIPLSAESQRYDLLFCFDDFARRDHGERVALVACRSDPPPEQNFDQMIFLSRHHARLMGYPECPSVGGGLNLRDYRHALRRAPGLVICTTSPDRCRAAFDIGACFCKFVFSYKPVPGLPPTKPVTREELVRLQKRAQALIYPLDPRRPSDFFSMAVLESMAAGTPVIVSAADSMPDLWAEAALTIPLPVRISKWVETVEDLLARKTLWSRYSALGRALAQRYDWSAVARRYLAAAGA